MIRKRNRHKPMNLIRTEWQDSRGITGLETAIVFIAFVVVSSVSPGEATSVCRA